MISRRSRLYPAICCLFFCVASIGSEASEIGTETPSTPESGPISSNFVTIGEQNLHYAAAGDIEKPGLLFIHGTPGSWTAFSGYLANPTLQENYFMVSVDRLGWGESAVPKESKSASVEFLTQALSLIHI